MIAIIAHINNEDPILGEIDQSFNSSDQLIILKNPRRKDGKDVHYLEPSVSTIIIPMHRINFIEILPTGVEEEIISFVRE